MSQTKQNVNNEKTIGDDLVPNPSAGMKLRLKNVN